MVCSCRLLAIIAFVLAPLLPLPRTRERRELTCPPNCFRNSLVSSGPRYVCWRRHAHALSYAHFTLHLFISCCLLTSDILSHAAQLPVCPIPCTPATPATLIAHAKAAYFPTKVDPTSSSLGPPHLGSCSQKSRATATNNYTFLRSAIPSPSIQRSFFTQIVSKRQGQSVLLPN